MFVPDMFAAKDNEETFRIIDANPFATVIGQTDAGMIATHVPVIIRREGEKLTHIECHFSRGNTHWKEIEGDVLVIFRGVEQYITPSWYETKQETGKVVPTWNYEAVHVNGTARAIQDADWLLRHVSDVTDRFEAPRDAPWATSDAPDGFMDVMVRGIVGVEIEVTNVITKVKASQNRTKADRKGVIEGLNAETEPAAHKMAQLVSRYADWDTG